MVITERRHAGVRKRQLRIARELSVLRSFIRVYCRAQHAAQPGGLCAGCADLLAYAAHKLERCPFDPKPRCKQCTAHCYNAVQRAKIRQVMRFSGMWFVKRGRLDWLLRYFLM